MTSPLDDAALDELMRFARRTAADLLTEHGALRCLAQDIEILTGALYAFARIHISAATQRPPSPPSRRPSDARGCEDTKLRAAVKRTRGR